MNDKQKLLKGGKQFPKTKRVGIPNDLSNLAGFLDVLIQIDLSKNRPERVKITK
jgi:ABC-type metal ion transport system substrate-binding protein